MIRGHLVPRIEKEEEETCMRILLLGAVAMSLLTSSAWAQRYDSPRDTRPQYDQDRASRGDRDNRDERRGDYREGGSVPYEYLKGGRYIHYDWAGVGLRRPPRDHQWLHVGNQFILADQRNGRILDITTDRRRAVWTRGGIVPNDLTAGGQHIHYEWRRDGLPRPPQGYAWMRLDDSFVLADQRTGKIRDVRDADDRDRRR